MYYCTVKIVTIYNQNVLQSTYICINLIHSECKIRSEQESCVRRGKEAPNSVQNKITVELQTYMNERGSTLQNNVYKCNCRTTCTSRSNCLKHIIIYK